MDSIDEKIAAIREMDFNFDDDIIREVLTQYDDVDKAIDELMNLQADPSIFMKTMNMVQKRDDGSEESEVYDELDDENRIPISFEDPGSENDEEESEEVPRLQENKYEINIESSDDVEGDRSEEEDFSDYLSSEGDDENDEQNDLDSSEEQEQEAQEAQEERPVEQEEEPVENYVEGVQEEKGDVEENEESKIPLEIENEIRYRDKLLHAAKNLFTYILPGGPQHVDAEGESVYVVRTNSLGIRHLREYVFTDKFIIRVNPNTNERREVRSYGDVKHVNIDGRNVQIHYIDGIDYLLIRESDVQRMMSILKEKCPTIEESSN